MTISSASRELSYPLPIKGGDILRTIQDARAFMLTLGPHREMRNHWQYARQLIMEEANVEVVTWQFHRALFMDGELDLIKFQRMNPRWRRSQEG
jgi:hypothetical protein